MMAESPSISVIADSSGNDEAWNSIDAAVMVLFFSMLIVGTGLQHSGAVGLIVEGIAPALEGLSPFVALAAVYDLSSLLTEAVSNNAVAVVVTPLAIGFASQIEPRLKTRRQHDDASTEA